MDSAPVSRRQFLQAGTAGAAALLLQQRMFPHLTTAELAAALPAAQPSTVRGAGRWAEAAGEQLAGALDAAPLDLNGVFLGPKAENAEFVEELLVDVFRDYVFWRRNFHPEDISAIDPAGQRDDSFYAFTDSFRRELFTLLGQLKSDIPFYSPRYIGHMTADTALPALVGYFATMLYDPNNVSWEASPITTLLELEVGRALARMVGFGSTPEELAKTWGHITSGGTLANIESIWVAKALKFLPLAVRAAAADLDVTGLAAGRDGRPLAQMSAWELVNLTPAAALDLKDDLMRTYVAAHPELDDEESTTAVTEALKQHDILSLGDHAFFQRAHGQRRPAAGHHVCAADDALLVGQGSGRHRRRRAPGAADRDRRQLPPAGRAAAQGAGTRPGRTAAR